MRPPVASLLVLGLCLAHAMAATFKINVISLLGKKTIVPIDDGDTVGVLKEKIQKREGFAAKIQRLVFHAQELQDSYLVTNYGIEAGSRVHLILRQPAPIVVEVELPDSRSIKLTVRTFTRVSMLKSMIYRAEGIPNHLQKLRFNRKTFGDASTIGEYGVGDGSAVQLTILSVELMTIYVEMENREKIPIQVHPRSTFEFVMDEVAKITKVHRYDQILSYRDNIMDSERMLEDYEIKPESILRVVVRQK